MAAWRKLADNPYLITLLLTDAEKGIGVNRLVCSKDPFPRRHGG
jgi:hypothetical protein